MPKANKPGGFHLPETSIQQPGFHVVGSGSQYFFVLISQQSKPVFSSHPYVSKKSAERALLNLKKKRPEDLLFSFHSSGEGWYFTLNSNKGKTKTGRSGAFKTEELARRTKDYLCTFLMVAQAKRPVKKSDKPVRPVVDQTDVSQALKYAYLIEMYRQEETAAYRARITNVRTERKLNFSDFDLKVLEAFIAEDIPDFVFKTKEAATNSEPKTVIETKPTLPEAKVPPKAPVEIPALKITPMLNGKQRKIFPNNSAGDLEITLETGGSLPATSELTFDLNLVATDRNKNLDHRQLKGVVPQKITSHSCLVSLPQLTVPGFYRIEVNTVRQKERGIGFLEVVAV